MLEFAPEFLFVASGGSRRNAIASNGQNRRNLLSVRISRQVFCRERNTERPRTRASCSVRYFVVTPRRNSSITNDVKNTSFIACTTPKKYALSIPEYAHLVKDLVA